MAADEIVLGSNAFTEQPLKRITKSGDPARTIRTFIGPQALADAKETELITTYNPLSISTVKGVPAVIEIETAEQNGGADPDTKVLTEVTWSLDWEREMRDIRSHGWFDTSGTAPKIMEQIDLAVKKGIAANTDWDASGGIPHMNDYMNHKLQGINQYMSYAPVVRATLVMARSTTLRALEMKVGKIIPWTDIKLPQPAGSAMTPSVGLIDQPKIHQYFGITNNPAGVTDNTWADVAVNQWMVLPVKRNFTKNPKRYEMHFEWLGAIRWTKALYDGGTGFPPSV